MSGTAVLLDIQQRDPPSGQREVERGGDRGSNVKGTHSLLVARSSGVGGKAHPEWGGDVREGLPERRTPELPIKVKGVVQQRWPEGTPGRGNNMCKGRKSAQSTGLEQEVPVEEPGRW